MKVLWLILPAVLMGVILASSPAPAQPKPGSKQVGPQDEPPLASTAIKKAFDPRRQKKMTLRIRYPFEEHMERIRWVGRVPVPYPPNYSGPNPEPMTRVNQTMRK